MKILRVLLASAGLLAGFAVSHAAPEPEPGEITVRISGCFTTDGREKCAELDQASWFFVEGRTANPSYVVRIASDHAATVLPLDSPSIPTAVKRDYYPIADERPPCRFHGRADRPCPYPEFSYGEAAFEITGGGVVRTEKGRFEPETRPALDEDEIRRVAPLIENGLPTGDKTEFLLRKFREGNLTPQPGPYRRAGSKLYFGMAGGFRNEGEGSIGGLAVYDMSDGSWKLYHPRELLEASVTDMLIENDTLWMGTVHYRDDYWPAIGIPGLVSFRFDSQTFQSHVLDSRSPPIVTMVRGRADSLELWLGTDSGLSLFDPKAEHWDNWEWENVDDKGDVPFRLKYVSKAAAN